MNNSRMTLGEEGREETLALTQVSEVPVPETDP